MVSLGDCSVMSGGHTQGYPLHAPFGLSRTNPSASGSCCCSEQSGRYTLSHSSVAFGAVVFAASCGLRIMSNRTWSARSISAWPSLHRMLASQLAFMANHSRSMGLRSGEYGGRCQRLEEMPVQGLAFAPRRGCRLSGSSSFALIEWFVRPRRERLGRHRCRNGWPQCRAIS